MYYIILFFILINFNNYYIIISANSDNDEYDVFSDYLLNEPAINKYIKQFQKKFNQIWLTSNLQNSKIQQQYDFIIVGSGPAGCVLANRLTENENYTVLLIEAGQPELPNFTDVPLSSPNLQSTKYNWGYSTEIQNKSCLAMKDHRCNWPHGRGLGGSTIINYSIYTRGNRKDFDNLAINNPGWSYSDVLPYFKKSEFSTLKFNNNRNGYHGHKGHLNVEHPPFKTKIADAFIKSSMLSGYKEIDYNSDEQLGVSVIQVTTKQGWRHTAAAAYLTPIINKRKNLQILTETWVTKLLFNKIGSRVIGLELLNENKKYIINVRKEIIVSAGTFESAKLLMLSGIGPKEHLHEFNIPVIKDLPVGKILYEHVGIYGPIFTVDKLNDGLTNIESVTKIKPIIDFYAGKGPLTSNGIESVLYFKVNNSLNTDPDLPDIECMQALGTVAFDSAPGTRRSIRLTKETYNAVFKPIENKRSFQFIPMLLHPQSKGHLKLKSRNPFYHPLLFANFFDNDHDINVLLQGIREIIKITEKEPFQKLGTKLYEAKIPGCMYTKFNTDEYWKCYIKHLTATLHHQIGTCKMGPITDSTSVVNSNLLVHGIENLRVGDISILPESPTAHTAAISFMIGEKLSDIIKKASEADHHHEQQQHQQQQQLQHRIKRHFDWQPKINDNQNNKNKNVEITAIENKSKENIVIDTVDNENNITLTKYLQINDTFVNATENEMIVGDVGIILWGHNNLKHKNVNLKKNINLENASTTKTPLLSSAFVTNKSAIEQILATVPSANEDMIRVVTLNKTDHYGHGKATPKFITKLLNKMNTTMYEDVIQTTANTLINTTNSNNRTKIMKMHTEKSITLGGYGN